MMEQMWNLNQGQIMGITSGLWRSPMIPLGSDALENESTDMVTFVGAVNWTLSGLRPIWTVVIVVDKLVEICHGRTRREGWVEWNWEGEGDRWSHDKLLQHWSRRKKRRVIWDRDFSKKIESKMGMGNEVGGREDNAQKNLITEKQKFWWCWMTLSLRGQMTWGKEKSGRLLCRCQWRLIKNNWGVKNTERNRGKRGWRGPEKVSLTGFCDEKPCRRVIPWQGCLMEERDHHWMMPMEEGTMKRGRTGHLEKGTTGPLFHCEEAERKKMLVDGKEVEQKERGAFAKQSDLMFSQSQKGGRMKKRWWGRKFEKGWMIKTDGGGGWQGRQLKGERKLKVTQKWSRQDAMNEVEEGVIQGGIRSSWELETF